MTTLYLRERGGHHRHNWTMKVQAVKMKKQPYKKDGRDPPPCNVSTFLNMAFFMKSMSVRLSVSYISATNVRKKHESTKKTDEKKSCADAAKCPKWTKRT